MSDFTAGFVARQDAAARALHHAFAGSAATCFSPADIKARASGAGPVSFSPQGDGPRHFSPADPGAKPTEGWDPFDSTASEAAPDSFVDPIEVAHAAGYAEGRAAAEAAAQTAQTRDRLLLEELASALSAGGQLDRERMAQQLRQTVLHLVRRIVGEIGVSPELARSPDRDRRRHAVGQRRIGLAPRPPGRCRADRGESCPRRCSPPATRTSRAAASSSNQPRRSSRTAPNCGSNSWRRRSIASPCRATETRAMLNRFTGDYLDTLGRADFTPKPKISGRLSSFDGLLMEAVGCRCRSAPSARSAGSPAARGSRPR